MKKISHFRNSVLTLLSWLFPLGLTFFATPYIVRGLGEEQYGLYVLMIGFIAYSFTFNVGRAVTKYVVEFNATGEKDKVTEIVSATFFLCLLLATAGCLILMLIAEPLVKNVLLIDARVSGEAVKGFYLVAVSIWLMIIGQVYTAVVQGNHRYDLFSLVTALTNAALILGNVFLVWRGYGFLNLVGWNLVTVFFNGLSFFYLARRLQPEARITLGFGKDIFLLSLKYGLSVAGYQLFANVLFIYERVIIMRVEGAPRLTNYVVPMTIAVLIHSFIGSFTMNVMAYSSELFALKKYFELETVYRRVTKIVAALVVFICLSLAVGSREFLTNWIDAEFAAASAGVFVLHLAIFGLLACQTVAWQFIEGYGRPVYNTVSGFSWFLIAVLLMPFLTGAYGIWGTALARLLGEVTIPLTIALIERKIFGRVLFGFWAKTLLGLAAAAFAAGALERLLFSYFSIEWFYFALVIFVCGVVYAGVLLVTSYFSKEEIIWLKSLYKRALA